MNLLFILLLLFTSCSKQDETESWKLVWSDDFTVDGAPDKNKWSFSGRKTPDWACYCTDQLENAEVVDGVLHLRGTLNSNESDTVSYHTGCIQTKGKFSFKYGRLEVRAKLGEGQGSWPAIWLMPEKSVYGSWPKSGEIDVMEQLNFDTYFYQTIHSEYIDVKKVKNNPEYYSTASFVANDFNIFGMEWYPDRIDFFVNGTKTFTYPKVDGGGSSQWPFDQEFYIILNQALGGGWPGPVNPDHLPVEMQVDWVKVYQKAAGN